MWKCKQQTMNNSAQTHINQLLVDDDYDAFFK